MFSVFLLVFMNFLLKLSAKEQPKATPDQNKDMPGVKGTNEKMSGVNENPKMEEEMTVGNVDSEKESEKDGFEPVNIEQKDKLQNKEPEILSDSKKKEKGKAEDEVLGVQKTSTSESEKDKTEKTKSEKEGKEDKPQQTQKEEQMKDKIEDLAKQ